MPRVLVVTEPKRNEELYAATENMVSVSTAHFALHSVVSISSSGRSKHLRMNSGVWLRMRHAVGAAELKIKWLRLQ